MSDTWTLIGVVAAMVAMVFMVRWRRRGHAQFLDGYAEEEICEHLRGALKLLKERGCVVVKAGQRAAELPVEIYLAPGFSPEEVFKELGLGEPVRVSERGVLICVEDGVELHPEGE